MRFKNKIKRLFVSVLALSTIFTTVTQNSIIAYAAYPVTITFDAGGGVFSDSSNSRAITIDTNDEYSGWSASVIASEEIPSAPAGKLWQFLGWSTSPTDDYPLVDTNNDFYYGDTTLRAVWQKEYDQTINRNYVFTNKISKVVTVSNSENICYDEDGNVTNYDLDGIMLNATALVFTACSQAGDTRSINGTSDYLYSDANLTVPLTEDDLKNALDTIYVDWRVSLSYKTYDGLTNTANSQYGVYYCLEGDEFPTIDAPTNVPDGYSFVGWYVGKDYKNHLNAGYTFTPSITYTGDSTDVDNYINFINDNGELFDYSYNSFEGSKTFLLYPQYEKNAPAQVTVKFNDLDGTQLSEVEVEPTATLNSFKPMNPTKESKLFLGWSTDGTEGNIVTDVSTFNSNVTLTAVYADYHKVTYALYTNDGSTFSDGTTDPKTYSYETNIQGQNNTVREANIYYSDMTPVIPTREGYIFCGWTTTSGVNYGDVYSNSSSYDESNNGTGFWVTSHTGTSFWLNYYNSPSGTVMTIYDSITVYPVWTKAVTFDACGGNFSDGSYSAYSTHEMLYDTYTTVDGSRQQTLWQNKCPVPTREGFQFVGWSNTQPTSNSDFTNTYWLNNQYEGVNSAILNDSYAYVDENYATAAKTTNDDGDTVYAVWVPAYTTITYHMDDMELDGTIQNNGIDGVTDYIDNSNTDDIKFVQYVSWNTNPNYQYSFKKDGRTVSNNWYKSRNFNSSDDYIGVTIPKQIEDIEVYTRQYVIVHFDYNYSNIVSTEQFELGENITSPLADDSQRFYQTIDNVNYYYTFGGWYTNANCTGTAVDFNSLTADTEVTYYAKWVEPTITHNVTFVDNIDGNTIDTKTVNRNSTVNAPEYTGSSLASVDNLIMIGWSETGSEDDLFDFNTPIVSDITIYTAYAEAVTVTFYDRGVIDEQVILKDTCATDIKYSGNGSGRTFLGWSETGSEDDLFDFSTTVSESLFLIAVYADNSINTSHFTLTFYSNDGVFAGNNTSYQITTSTDENGNQYINLSDSIQIPTRAGYEFLGYAYGADDETIVIGAGASGTMIVRQDTEFYAVWKPMCKVNFNSNGGSEVQSQWVKSVDRVLKPADPTREGYTFDCWTFGLLEYNFNSPVTQNITLVAQWTQNTMSVVQYTVTFKDWDGTVLKTETVESGSAATAPANPTREGYTFIGWSCNFTNVTSDLEVTAQYSQNTPEVPEEEPEVPEEPTVPEEEPEVPEEPTIPEEEPEVEVEPEPIYVGDDDSDKETEATVFGRFVEAVKTVAVVVVISLGTVLGLFGLLLLMILWMKRVKVLNNRNADDHNEENFKVVYRTSVKTEGNVVSELSRQEDRVWVIVIADEIINERVTDTFRIELKKLFCKRYNGEQLVIKIGNGVDARELGCTIDEKENTIEFNITE